MRASLSASSSSACELELVLRRDARASTRERAETIRDRINARVDAWTRGHVFGRAPLTFEVTRTSYGWTLRASVRALEGQGEDAWAGAACARAATTARGWEEVACARVWDEDGEFLLVEVAETLPRWVTPERATGTTFVRGGALVVVDAERCGGVGERATARAIELVEGTAPLDEACQRAFRARLDAVEGRIRALRHDALATMPRSAARVLLREPGVVALAIDSLRARDPAGMRAVSKMAVFEPKDFHPTLVRMTRALFVHATSEEFAAPAGYPMPSSTSSEYAAHELGMKITCGLEMFLAEWAASRGSDANATDDEASTSDAEPTSDPVWERFKASLASNGYFRDEMVGSALYKQLLASAVREYHESGLANRVRRATNVSVERVRAILAEPESNGDDLPTATPDQASDEKWLLEAENELLNELARLEREREERVVEATRRAKSFVKRESGFEGVEGVQDHNAAPGSCPGDLNIPNGADVFNLDARAFLKELGKALHMEDDEKFRSYMGTAGGDDDDDSTDSDDDFDFDDSDDENARSDLPDDDFFAPQTERSRFVHVDEDAPDSDDEGDDDRRAFDSEYDAVLRQQLADVNFDIPKVESTSADVSAALARGLIASASAADGAPGPASALLRSAGVHPDVVRDLARAETDD